MNAKSAAGLLAGLLAACAQTQPQVATAPPAPAPASAPAPAKAQVPKPVPADHTVNILRANCRDLLGLGPADRDAASMFYIGYQASRFRSRTINVGLIPSIADQALTYCVENPNRTVAEVFAEAYQRIR